MPTSEQLRLKQERERKDALKDRYVLSYTSSSGEPIYSRRQRAPAALPTAVPEGTPAPFEAPEPPTEDMTRALTRQSRYAGGVFGTLFGRRESFGS